MSIEFECDRPRSVQNLQDLYFSFRTNFASITPSADEQRRYADLSKSIDRSILMWKAKDFITQSGSDYARAASPQIKEALDSIDPRYWPSIYIGPSQTEPVPIFYPSQALARLLENVRAQASDWRLHPPTP